MTKKETIPWQCWKSAVLMGIRCIGSAQSIPSAWTLCTLCPVRTAWSSTWALMMAGEATSHSTSNCARSKIPLFVNNLYLNALLLVLIALHWAALKSIGWCARWYAVFPTLSVISRVLGLCLDFYKAVKFCWIIFQTFGILNLCCLKSLEVPQLSRKLLQFLFPYKHELIRYHDSTCYKLILHLK